MEFDFKKTLHRDVKMELWMLFVFLGAGLLVGGLEPWVGIALGLIVLVVLGILLFVPQDKPKSKAEKKEA